MTRTTRTASTATRISRSLLVAGFAASIVGFSGCSGQSRYTEKAASGAQLRMDALKSATSWDMSRQAFLAGNLDKAEKHIDISLGLNPTVAKSHTLRGRIMLEQGNLGEAIASFDEAIRTEPDYVDAHYFRGVVLERLGKLDQALESYFAAADFDKYNSQYAIAAAETLVDLDRTAEAEEYLFSRTQYLEHDAGLRHTLGHIAHLQGDDQASLRLLHEAWLLAPNDNAIAEDLIRAQIANNDFLSAEANLSQLLAEEGFGNRSDLLIMHARCLTNLGRPVDARQALFNIVRSNEGMHNAEAWLGLGHISYRIGDLRSLREAATRLTEIAKDAPEGYVLWTMWYRARGEHEAALSWIDEAAHRNGDQVSLLTLRGLTLADLGRTDEARASFNAAARLDPSNAKLAELVKANTFASVPTD